MGSAPQSRKILIFGLLCLWSLRLTAYLGWRKWGEGEDPRYTKLRGWVEEGWPFHRFVLRQVFGLQGATMFLLGLPLIISLAADEPDSFGPITYVGVAVWAVGFFFTNPERSMQLWSGIIGTSGFDAEALFVQQSVTTTHCRVARY
jgi:steroid 5-alpha reductase family enzyme